MPTIYPPQLDHESFDWSEQPQQFTNALLQNEERIFQPLRLDADDDRAELLQRLSDILSLAAAVRIDAGYKSTNRVIATIAAVEKNPLLIFDRSVEPEALGEIGRNYQRSTEPAGTFWFDVDQSDALGRQQPSLAQVSEAARAAIEALRSEASPGKPEDIAARLVADKLSFEYARYNGPVRRHSVITSKGGKLVQEEGGPFLFFAQEVLCPLNDFLSRRNLKPISPATVVRFAADQASPGGMGPQRNTNKGANASTHQRLGKAADSNDITSLEHTSEKSEICPETRCDSELAAINRTRPQISALPGD